jgi:hypothetical protein
MLATSNYGPFRFDGISFSGPKDYGGARGLALLDAILSGEDNGYEPGAYPVRKPELQQHRWRPTGGARLWRYVLRNARG